MKKLVLAALVFFGMGVSSLIADQIKYIGSSTVGKFVIDASKVYTDVTFKINTKPESGGGEKATAAGKTDIGGVARDVNPKILAKGVQKVLIGKDAIGVWVNGSNPVSNLSSAELVGIFTGKITNWKEVGGSDAKINVYIVNKNSATRKVFQSVILKGAEYKGASIKTIKPDPRVLDEVKKDANGIGQLSFAFGAGASGVKKVAVDGQEASVKNSSYPITRPLYLITKGTPSPKVQKFIDWSLSSAGQDVVKKYFVGVN